MEAEAKIIMSKGKFINPLGNIKSTPARRDGLSPGTPGSASGDFSSGDLAKAGQLVPEQGKPKKPRRPR